MARARKGSRESPAVSRARASFTAFVVALLLGATACATAAPGGRAEAEIRVLVFNIHAGKDAGGVDNLERVAALVRETAADIVLLQEVDVRTQRSGGIDQPAVLDSLTGHSAAFGRTLDYQGGLYGIAVLSRWPIVRDTMFQLPVSPPQGRAGGSYEPRGALMAVIETPAGPVTVLNTHLDASGEEHYRLQELGTLSSIARRLSAADGPLLVGGDFNARPESEVIRRAGEAGWRDAWAECGSGGEGFTFPSVAPVRRIDYLFLADGATCTQARVVGEETSDHRGLLVTVLVRR